MEKKTLAFLPPSVELETKKVLKRLNDANRELALLNGFSRTIPNQYVLIRALSLQEAKDSSEIESIITTTDELYQAELFDRETISPQAKEVRNYAEALLQGYEQISKGELLSINNICAIQRVLEKNDAGIRRQSGTTLKNAATGEIVYTPPQDYDTIISLLGNLEQVINADDFWPDIDPLIKMAVIHYQFESIHPFFDGNGRTGRIINVLYLVLKKLLDAPILYLSRYIISYKGTYYRCLQEVRTQNKWENFVLFMLDAVVETSQMTAETIKKIDESMLKTKRMLREKFKFYSRDLVDALYLFPYTRIQHLQRILHISRNTATSYLNKMAEYGILAKMTRGKNVYFVNKELFLILSTIPNKSDNETMEIVTDNGAR